MRINFLALLSNIVLISTLISCTPDELNSPDTLNYSQNREFNYTYETSEIETMKLINDYRTNIGLKALIQNNYLSIKSEEHNNYMITEKKASHDNFSTRFHDISEALGAIYVAENIVYNTTTPQSALKCWLMSPSHKLNVEGDFTHFGISIRIDSKGKKYFTNIFAKY